MDVSIFEPDKKMTSVISI